eukprot:5017666-Pyramimonas_sp.AAC.1
MQDPRGSSCAVVSAQQSIICHCSYWKRSSAPVARLAVYAVSVSQAQTICPTVHESKVPHDCS